MALIVAIPGWVIWRRAAKAAWTRMGLFDIGELDNVIHGRVGLGVGVMAYLADAEAADELKLLLDVTQGDLAVHLRKLEEAGYVSIDRVSSAASCWPGAHGRAAFPDYLGAIGKLVGGGRS